MTTTSPDDWENRRWINWDRVLCILFGMACGLVVWGVCAMIRGDLQ